METKLCTKCKVDKPLNEFSKDKRRKSGLRAECKECVNKYAKKYRKLNHDYDRERHVKYHKEHIDKEKKWQKEYNLKISSGLTDKYLIDILIKEYPFLTRKEIKEHPEWIELKRLRIENLRQHKLTNKK